MNRCAMLAGAAGLALAPFAMGQNTPEVEPNETKAQATAVLAPMAVGHTLTGNTTGTSTTVAGAASADTFRVKTAPDATAIYQYRLTLTSATLLHSATIRGLNQTSLAQAPWAGAPGGAVGTTDTTIQTSVTTPARFVQWYGFGRGEELYYRVTGTAASTTDYTATLTRATITPQDVGTYAPGFITVSTLGQGHTTDTEIIVLDGNLTPIFGFSDDDEAVTAVSGVPGATGTTLQSVLRRQYAPGTYFIAISTFNTCTNLVSPSDDDFRTGALLDFPDAIVNSVTTTNQNIAFSISDGTTTTPVPATKVGAFDVNFFRFTVSGGGCYANCDGSTGNPALTGNDFVCFINKYNNGDTYANCDGSTGNPLLTGNDFVCFINKYNGGCT